MEHKRSVTEVLRKVLQISIWKFIKYNFMTPNIHRRKNAYVIPFKNSILEMDKSAVMELNGTIHFGIGKARGSKAETFIRMGRGTKWVINGDVSLAYNVFVDIQEKAFIESEFFSANCGSVIVCGKHITIGNDVMIGRNVIIYDSDFHVVFGGDDNPVNYSQDVVIGDHVWLTHNISVLKGVIINEGAVISPKTLVRNEVPAASLFAGNPGKVIRENIKWSRDQIHNYE